MRDVVSWSLRRIVDVVEFGRAESYSHTTLQNEKMTKL
jgi:hypothetical protein